MSTRDAKKHFENASASLRGTDDRDLWEMNAGLLKMCDEIDRANTNIVRLSQQIARR